jgi:hypothetical protein
MQKKVFVKTLTPKKGATVMKTKLNFTGQAYDSSVIWIWLPLFLVLGLLVTGTQAIASSACAQTSKAALAACTSSATSDYWLGIGACDNLSDRQERQNCIDEARHSLNKEDLKTCNEQFQARQEVCRDLGGGPYDPDFSSENFVSNPADLTGNSYFPLTPGTYTYKSKDTAGNTLQTIVVRVKDDTTTIAGVLCRVVTDKVYEGAGTGGRLLEDTIDWYAQDSDGDVWYFGETTIAFTFDEAGNPTASTEGSWMAGMDEAKPGIIMFSVPEDQIGLLFRQEFALGTAEDLGRVIGTDASVTAGGVKHTGCVHTQDSTPLEPGVIEDKYYAPGVGLVLTVDPDGTREELIP